MVGNNEKKCFFKNDCFYIFLIATKSQNELIKYIRMKNYITPLCAMHINVPFRLLFFNNPHFSKLSLFYNFCKTFCIIRPPQCGSSGIIARQIQIKDSFLLYGPQWLVFIYNLEHVVLQMKQLKTHPWLLRTFGFRLIYDSCLISTRDEVSPIGQDTIENI